MRTTLAISSAASGDGGLRLERTMLAWRRTAAAFLVAAAVALGTLLLGLAATLTR